MARCRKKRTYRNTRQKVSIPLILNRNNYTWKIKIVIQTGINSRIHHKKKDRNSIYSGFMDYLPSH